MLPQKNLNYYFEYPSVLEYQIIQIITLSAQTAKNQTTPINANIIIPIIYRYIYVYITPVPVSIREIDINNHFH